MRWPSNTAVAFDTYLREYVEVCEPGSYPGTITCRRITHVEPSLYGTMMPLPVYYFVPATRLASKLLRIARNSR